MLKTKCVYDAKSKTDGLRILATRFRGHGMKSDKYDVWMANLGPSEKLLKDTQITWHEFKKRYKEEITSSVMIDKKNDTILNHGQKFTLRLIQQLSKNQNVTLMCHCETGADECHLRVLEKIIEGIKII